MITNKYVGHYQLTTSKLSNSVVQILVADAQYFTHVSQWRLFTTLKWIAVISFRNRT